MIWIRVKTVWNLPKLKWLHRRSQNTKLIFSKISRGPSWTQIRGFSCWALLRQLSMRFPFPSTAAWGTGYFGRGCKLLYSFHASKYRWRTKHEKCQVFLQNNPAKKGFYENFIRCTLCWVGSSCWLGPSRETSFNALWSKYVVTEEEEGRTDPL